MKRFIFYLHGLLLAVIAPIAMYSILFTFQIFSPPQEVWRMVFFCLLVPVFISIPLFLITKEHSTTALIAGIATLAILYPSYLFWALFPILILTWGVLAFVSRKRKSNLVIFNGNMSLLLVSLCMAFYTSAQFLIIQKNTSWTVTENLLPSVAVSLQDNIIYKPDIYYIILDGYGSQVMLHEIHGYDNSEFVQALEARGFTIPTHSKSNYHRSVLSISSSLNMQYLDSLSEIMGDSPLWWPMAGAFSQSHAQEILKTQGYQTVNVASGWDFTTLPGADYYKDHHAIRLNRFEKYFIQFTTLSILSVFDWKSVSFPSHGGHRQTVLHAFDELQKIPDIPGPKFVLVHIVSPHPPFLFDAQGNHTTPDHPLTFADNKYFLSPISKYRNDYLEQLQFVNRKTLAAIDTILENSLEPPIIIIQADHGPGLLLDTMSLENSCLNERYSILNAYHLPGVPSEEIPEDISPVNTFRLIFNHYFGADLEILSNYHYFSSSSTIYQFQEISSRLNDVCMITE